MKSNRPRATIVRAASEVRGHREVRDAKTGRKRSVTLPELRNKLVAHLSQYGKPLDRDSLVFTGPDGGPIRQNVFRRRVFQPAAARPGIDPVPRVHDLRHTAVAFALAANWHPKKVQDMVGHTSIVTTLDTYGHLFDDLHGDDVDGLDAMYQK